jgi:hypothetical protein
MKKIYFFEFCNLTPHLETSLDIAKQHLDKGDMVFFYFLGHDVPYRESIFPAHFSGKFLGDLLPERKGAKLLEHPRFKFITNVYIPKSEYAIPPINNIEELKAIVYENWDLGMAVASSLISLTKNSQPDLRKYSNMLSKMVISVASIYHFVIDLLKSANANNVYIFNGRFCNQRAVLRACEALNVPYLIQERGANKDLYFLRPFMPHDKKSIQAEMKTTWEKLHDKAKGEEIAVNWFRNRRSGMDTDWYSYSKTQKQNSLPVIDEEKHLVTYFHSSDDEYAAIGDQFKWIGWNDQYDAVTQLINLAKDIQGVQLVIRLHPHLAKKSKEENIKWAALSELSKKITVILPSSEIDSYALIDHSNLVISAGSKAGIEAVFYGKPSVLLGPSPYDDLDVTYKAHDVKTLETLILDPALPLKNHENLLMYGYWWATHGDRFKYYVAESLSKGKFMGVNLQEKPLVFSMLLSAKKKILK